MTPQAIAKLRRTFIAIATASFLVVIVVMGAASSLANIVAVTSEANRTIDAIIDADGDTPGEGNFRTGPFHEEASFGLRFFTVRFDANGDVVEVDLSHIASVDQEQAIEAAEGAADPATLSGLGRYESYLYKEGATDDGSMVVFLDCSIQLANARETIVNTLFVCLGAVVVTFVSVFFFSKRAIQPEVENARRQQRFVTNASHELKTPIAVIRANTELTEMMSGETEWTRSTMRQVDRLDSLVRDLMTIVRGQERAEASGNPVDIDVTAVATEAVESFRGVAAQKGLGLETAIDEGVRTRGTRETVEQLVCLLVDNAMKYCDEGGAVLVSVTASRIGRGFTLIVSNDFAEGADVDYHRFFDRFYREDEAHENQQGYGIGLSVAESICNTYNGSIKASWKAGTISFTCALKGM